MKIIIETTDSDKWYSFKRETTVPYDDLTLEEMFQMFAELMEGTWPGAIKFLEGGDDSI